VCVRCWSSCFRPWVWTMLLRSPTPSLRLLCLCCVCPAEAPPPQATSLRAPPLLPASSRRPSSLHWKTAFSDFLDKMIFYRFTPPPPAPALRLSLPCRPPSRTNAAPSKAVGRTGPAPRAGEMAAGDAARGSRRPAGGVGCLRSAVSVRPPAV
jgi:hypothetical protein